LKEIRDFSAGRCDFSFQQHYRHHFNSYPFSNTTDLNIGRYRCRATLLAADSRLPRPNWNWK
jgi:hypothetical protein